MAYPDGALAVWFGKDRQNDPNRLQAWRKAPLTYFPNDPIDHHWNADRYEIILGQDATGGLFERAAALTLRNRFYPPEVMTAVSDFSLAGREVQAGDRVLQRIRIFQYAGLPILEVLTLNEITEVIREPRRAGFTYTTTLAHAEVGEWSPRVEWRENNEVVLVIDVLSKARSGASDFSRRFSRRMQLRAHKLSIQNFLAQLHHQPAPAEQSKVQPGLLPLALLGLALVLLVGLLLGVTGRD